LLRFTKEDGSRCGKLNGSLRPVEELDAKLLFQVEDGLANRGLRHVQATRRLAVVQVMRNADKVTQMSKLHNFTPYRRIRLLQANHTISAMARMERCNWQTNQK
jgi:hypothetical protein